MRDNKLNHRHLNSLCLVLSKNTSGKQAIVFWKKKIKEKERKKNHASDKATELSP